MSLTNCKINLILINLISIWITNSTGGTFAYTKLYVLVAILHEKSYFLFPNVLKRWYFQKNCTGRWPLLYYQERWYFLFPKISSYSIDGKWKMIFLKKYMEIWYSFKCFEKMVFPKKNSTGIWSFLLYYVERWHFFPLKIWSYCLDGKWKMTFLEKVHENVICSSNAPKRLPFQNRSRWNTIFLVLSGKMVFFSRKYDFFLWTENERWSFSRNTWKCDIFCIYV